MKNLIILLLLTLTCNYSFSQETEKNNTGIMPFSVFLFDTTDVYSNVRINPNGEIMLKLDYSNDYFILTVIDYKNGWFKINNIVSVEYGYNISNFEGWIHHSLIAVTTRKNLELKEKPNSKKMVGTINLETTVQIIDVWSNWAKIKYKENVGWVESKWLCGNPVTTCP